MTTYELMAVDEGRGVVMVTNIDAYDRIPIVDLKAVPGM
jgi:tRNA (Thr-GGU) A37 N-methylase